MPEHIQYQDDDLFNPETHHEHSDVPVRPLWKALILFIVFGVITHVVLLFMYRAFVKAERARMDPPQTNVAVPADAVVPKNQPLLQPFPSGNVPPYQSTPVTDMVDMRRSETQALTSYGWIDKQHGVVRIPIDVAKDLAVQRLRTQTPSAPPPAATPGGVQP